MVVNDALKCQDPNTTNYSSTLIKHPESSITTTQLSPPPTITTGTSEHYIQTCAQVCAHANQNDQFSIILQLDKKILPQNYTTKDLITVLYELNIFRLNAMIANKAIIAESSNFAAVACWCPPDDTRIPPTEEDINAMEVAGKKTFARFLREAEECKREVLYPVWGHRYWHLALMARDPRVAYVPGAVRAVVDPFIERARREGVPLWLEAVEGAKGVYEHFGWKVVRTIEFETTSVFCMILDPS